MNAKSPILLSRRERFGPGFTMVELLVVVAIVSVLAVLTFTLTGRMKDKAKQVAAVNILKQVAIGNFGYAQDNNGDLNVLLEAADQRAQAPVVANSFWGRLAPYMYSDVDMNVADQDQLRDEVRRRLEALFQSQDLDNMGGTFQQGVPIHKDASDLPVPFAFNDTIHETDRYIKSSSFRDMAQIIYFCYGSEYITQTDGDEYTPLPTNGARTSNLDWFNDSTAAFIFLDGHMEMLSAPIPTRRFIEQ